MWSINDREPPYDWRNQPEFRGQFEKTGRDGRQTAGAAKSLEGSVAQTKSRQERFEESFIQLVEMVSHIDHRVDRLELARQSDDERWRRFAEANALLVQMIRNHEERLDSLAESDGRLRESDKRRDAKFAEMLETHRRTEERLDAFIVMLERYISEGRNGDGGGTKNNEER